MSFTDRYINDATFGRSNKSTESQRFEPNSNGIQHLETGRAGQWIKSATPANNVGRYLGLPESSIRQPTRGSATNERSTNHTPNILGSGIRQDDPDIAIKVEEAAARTAADDEDDYGWHRH